MESKKLDETRPTSPDSGEGQITETTSSPIGSIAVPTPEENKPFSAPVTASSDEGADESRFSAANEAPPPVVDEPAVPVARRGSKRWILWAILGVFLLALIAAGSVYAGYNSAVDARMQNQSTMVAGEAANQFILAQQDIALKNYDRARQRLEYVIQLDPNYPDASNQLTFILTQQRITASPTLAPTPTLTPTPDYRTRDEMFTQAQNLLVGHDWTGVIDTLLLLRKNYPDYMAVKVDGMLFVALRNRGLEKISQKQDLEGGNYDLTLAERFGPLDGEAQTWREWAGIYILGASYWGVDWAQSVYYFAQIADAVPNMSDASGWTAINRYKDALLGYGDWLAAKGEWCSAQEQYDTYMTLLADPQVEPTAVHAAEQCSSGAQPPETTGTPGTPGAPVTTPGATQGATEVPTTPTAPVPTQQPQNTPYP